MRYYRFLLGFLSAFAFLGCAVFSSISTSSQSLDSVSTSVSAALNSISRSVSSISRSSPGSQAKSETYQKDIEVLVSFYASHPEMAEFMEADIAKIAERHGILDWQSYDRTYTSIGRGLRKAGFTQSQVEELAKASCPGKEKLVDAILEGYGI